MRGRSSMILSGCTVLLIGMAAAGGQAEDIDQVRNAFERHNYRVALERVDRLLAGDIDDAARLELQRMRGVSLIQLREFEAGVHQLTDIVDRIPDPADRMRIHEALGELGLQQGRYRHLAVDHFHFAANQAVTLDEPLQAARFRMQRAEGILRMSQWSEVRTLTFEPPSGWRENRRALRELAIAELDMAIDLARNNDIAAEALVRKARLYEQEFRQDNSDVDEALRLLRRASDGWPQSHWAAEALHHIGRILANYKEDFPAAVTAFQRVVTDHPRSKWARQAARQIEQITEPQLQLRVEGPVSPTQPGEIQFQARNIKHVSFSAYRVDLFEMIQKVEQWHRLDRWTPTGETVATWDMNLADTGEHKWFRSGANDLQPTWLPTREPGAYFIVGESADAKLRSSVVMIVSNLACLAKGARSGTLLYATDADAGKPATHAEVLVQRHIGNQQYRYAQATTDDAGISRLQDELNNDKGGGRNATIIVRQGEHYAICSTYMYWYWWGYGESVRAYTFTERPVYRPDQTIYFKSTLRGYDKGEYANLPNFRASVKVHNPNGDVIDTQQHQSNDDGSFSGEIHLPEGAPLGVYSINVNAGGQQLWDHGASFRVEEYRKPEFKVTVKPDRPDCRIGEKLDVSIEAKYYFGEPVVDADVVCTVHRTMEAPRFPWRTPWPWLYETVTDVWAQRCFAPPYMPWRFSPREYVGRYELKTNAQGAASLQLETKPLEQDSDADIRYEFEVEVTDSSRRVITGSGSVKVTHEPFRIFVQPMQYVYQPGDNVKLEVEAKGPNDEPIAFRGQCKVYRLKRTVVEDNDRSRDKYELGEMIAGSFFDVGENGKGVAQWKADKEGPFRVIVVATPDADTEVTGTTDIWITRQGGRYAHYAYRDVEILPDKMSYKIGETAHVLVNTQFDDAFVLLTSEADDLLDHRIVFVPGGSQLVELPITKAHVPNFSLHAAVMRNNAVHQDEMPIVVPPVDRFLNVTVDAGGDTFKPRQEVEISVAVSDSAGKPAPAELALMLVDSSIYYIQPEFRRQVEQFFYGQTRPDMISTTTSFDMSWYGRQEEMREAGVAGGVADMAQAAPNAAMKTMARNQAGAKESLFTDDDESSGPEFAEAEVRKDFPDTVLWSAHVSAGADGKATATVQMPDTLTTWRLHAIAIDRDTRVGQTSADLVTRKDVIARLQAPRFLVQGDRAFLTVIAHNYLDESKQMRISLDATDPLRIEEMLSSQRSEVSKPFSMTFDVPAKGEMPVDVPVYAVMAGTSTVTATVATDVDADAMQIELPIITFGADRFVAQSGAIRGGDADLPSSKTVVMTLPQEVEPSSPLMEIHISPSIASVMIDALPYLLEYPYGCTEQTMSRFLPAVVTRRTLGNLNINLADVRRRIEAQGGPATDRLPDRRLNNPVFNEARMDDMIQSGVKRLAQLQQSDGGWGWWSGGQSNPYMTAYVVYGLAEAANSDIAFDRNMLARGVDFLIRQVTADGPISRYGWTDQNDDNVRVWMLYALSTYDAKLLAAADVRKVIDRVYEDRDGLTDYSRAMLMMAFHRMDDKDRAGILVENLYNNVRLDDELQTASWGNEGDYRWWYDGSVEATAMVLRSLLAAAPDHDYVPRAVNWLVRNRRGSRWFNTKDTAFCVYALADYLVASKELQADMTVNVSIDGRINRDFRIRPEDVLTADTAMIIAPKNLIAGEHTVQFTKMGAGTLYYSVYLDYFTREDPVPPAGHEVFVTRKYYKLTPKVGSAKQPNFVPGDGGFVEKETEYATLDYDRAPIADRELLTSGDLIEVVLSIDAKNNFEYLIFEDPKPAGCEPVDVRSGPAFGKSHVDRDDAAGKGPFRGGSFYVNVELRDQKTAFFADYVPQGKHELTYRLRCETPGEFHALPARGDAMYTPYVRSNSRSDVVAIQGK